VVLKNHIIHNYEFKIFSGLTIITMSNDQNLGRHALYEEVAERLRQRIFTRELIPGSWIDEMKISQEYGISRTPLREALKVLATEGLVTMKMRRGAYVTEVSDKDLNDVYHLLSLLESDAAAQVAQWARAEDMEELQNLHRQLEQAAQNRAAFFEINERFHMRLLEIGQNKWRTQMVLDLRKVMKLNRQNSLLKSGRVEESLREHQTLMQALSARNPALSRQAMQAHFANGLEAASPDAFVPPSTPPQVGLAVAVG
jgi:DNA-binding GntR family transcriptional regulator